MSIPGGLITNIDSVVQMTNLSYSGAGSWNDADMVQICTFGEGATRHFNSTGVPGNRGGDGMTLNEYISHYSIWAIWGSPLILSADLRTVGSLHPECLDLMLNSEIIAVNQDRLAAPARLLYTTDNATDGEEVNSTRITSQAWARPLWSSGGNGGKGSGARSGSSGAGDVGGDGVGDGNRDGDEDGDEDEDEDEDRDGGERGGEEEVRRIAVVLFNRDEKVTKMAVDWAQLGVEATASLRVRDVILRKDMGQATGRWEVEVAPHSVSFVVLTRVEEKAPVLLSASAAPHAAASRLRTFVYNATELLATRAAVASGLTAPGLAVAQREAKRLMPVPGAPWSNKTGPWSVVNKTLKTPSGVSKRNYMSIGIYNHPCNNLAPHCKPYPGGHLLPPSKVR